MVYFLTVWLFLLTVWTIRKWRQNVDLWKTHIEEGHPQDPKHQA